MSRLRRFLTFAELGPAQAAKMSADALRMRRSRRASRALAGKTMAMMFAKPSTRTRVSFEVAMIQLGGHAVNLAGGQMQTARGETLADTARTLSRYVDVIMARVYEHAEIEEIADNAGVPVINGLSNLFHPCQTLADLATILQHKKRLRGLSLAWVGDGNNVCNSLLLGCARTGISVSVATPGRFEPDVATVEAARDSIDVRLVREPREAVRGADVVVTDTFASIHDKESRLSKFLPRYRVSAALMRRAADGAIFMHCLPAKRGHEVEAAVIDGPQSVVWDEAENRLYAQKVLLLSMLR